jgi:hypothetical protein
MSEPCVSRATKSVPEHCTYGPQGTVVFLFAGRRLTKRRGYHAQEGHFPVGANRCHETVLPPGCIEKLWHQTENHRERSFVFQGQFLREQEGPVISGALVPTQPICNRSVLPPTLLDYSNPFSIHHLVLLTRNFTRELHEILSC